MFVTTHCLDSDTETTVANLVIGDVYDFALADMRIRITSTTRDGNLVTLEGNNVDGVDSFTRSFIVEFTSVVWIADENDAATNYLTDETRDEMAAAIDAENDAAWTLA